MPPLDIPATHLRWLYIDFNSYFASVEQQLDPRLRDRPIAVIPVESDYTCAIAASYEAKAFGIRTGTPVHEARKLCKDLICVLGRHEEYVSFHGRIIEEIERHIPVSAVCSIDEMACQLMRNECSVEQIKNLARNIKAGLARNIGPYVRCSIGAAPSKYLAKVATDMQKPDGLTILQPHDIPEGLLHLALRDLPGIGANVEHRLNRAGIFDIKALLSLSPRHLRAIWGNLWGEKMWYYLRGHDLPDPETNRSSIGHSHVLAPHMRPWHNAMTVARQLTLRSASRLRRLGYYATAMSVSFRIENGQKLSLIEKHPSTQDNFQFLSHLEKMRRQFESTIGTPRLKKVGIVLHGLATEKTMKAQPDLFSNLDTQEKIKTEIHNHKLSIAMDKINHKFGRGTISIGLTPTENKKIGGTKVAFTRIPDLEEFYE